MVLLAQLRPVRPVAAAFCAIPDTTPARDGGSSEQKLPRIPALPTESLPFRLGNRVSYRFLCGGPQITGAA